MCKRHGAKVKLCSVKGCTKKAHSAGVCSGHGVERKRCSKEGCTNLAQQGGVCKRHGAKRKDAASKDAQIKFMEEVYSMSDIRQRGKDVATYGKEETM